MFITSHSLRHTLLVAMPQMQDKNFTGSVIYLCEHNARGAMGLIINRPTGASLNALIKKIGMDFEGPDSICEPVRFGGPVEMEYGFILHTYTDDLIDNNALVITHNIALTSSPLMLAAIAAGKGPGRYLVTMGYAGWGPGQLEQELAANAWLNCPAPLSLIFDTPCAEQRDQAFRLIGIDHALLSYESGHA